MAYKYQRARRSRVGDLSMKTKTHFAFRVDIWDNKGDSIVEHVARCGGFRGGGSDLPGSRGARAA
jgi:hypothetical protein